MIDLHVLWSLQKPIDCTPCEWKFPALPEGLIVIGRRIESKEKAISILSDLEIMCRKAMVEHHRQCKNEGLRNEGHLEYGPPINTYVIVLALEAYVAVMQACKARCSEAWPKETNAIVEVIKNVIASVRTEIIRVKQWTKKDLVNFQDSFVTLTSVREVQNPPLGSLIEPQLALEIEAQPTADENRLQALIKMFPSEVATLEKALGLFQLIPEEEKLAIDLTGGAQLFIPPKEEGDRLGLVEQKLTDIYGGLQALSEQEKTLGIEGRIKIFKQVQGKIQGLATLGKYPPPSYRTFSLSLREDASLWPEAEQLYATRVGKLFYGLACIGLPNYAFDDTTIMQMCGNGPSEINNALNIPMRMIKNLHSETTWKEYAEELKQAGKAHEDVKGPKYNPVAVDRILDENERGQTTWTMCHHGGRKILKCVPNVALVDDEKKKAKMVHAFATEFLTTMAISPKDVVVWGEELASGLYKDHKDIAQGLCLAQWKKCSFTNKDSHQQTALSALMPNNPGDWAGWVQKIIEENTPPQPDNSVTPEGLFKLIDPAIIKDDGAALLACVTSLKNGNQINSSSNEYKTALMAAARLLNKALDTKTKTVVDSERVKAATQLVAEILKDDDIPIPKY